MTHSEFEDRVEAAFAPDATREARATLAREAAADPELAENWADLAPALDALAGARLEPLPDGLHAELMVAARTPTHPGTSWLSHVRSLLEVRPAYALGGAIAAALLITLGVALYSGGLRHASELAPGTSASLPPAPASPAPAVASTRLDRGNTHVELQTRKMAGGFVVRIVARGAEKSTLALTWDSREYGLSNVHWAPNVSPVQSSPGQVTVPLPVGNGSELTLSQVAAGNHSSTASTVRVTLRAPGGELHETLRLPR